MQAFILLIKKRKKKKASKKARHHLHERGGREEKRTTNKNSSVNQEQSRFQPRNGRESSIFNEGKCRRRGGLASVFCGTISLEPNFTPSHPMRISTPSLWEHKVPDGLQSTVLYLISSLFQTLSRLQAGHQGWDHRRAEDGTERCHQRNHREAGWCGAEHLLPGQAQACWASRRSSLIFCPSVASFCFHYEVSLIKIGEGWLFGTSLFHFCAGSPQSRLTAYCPCVHFCIEKSIRKFKFGEQHSGPCYPWRGNYFS